MDVDLLEAKRRQVSHAATSYLRSKLEPCGLGEMPGSGEMTPAAFTVGQFMTPNPTCIGPGLSVPQLVELFHAKQFRHLLVVEDQRLVGLVSDRDVIACFGPHGKAPRDFLETLTAADLMSTDLITVGPEMKLQDAVRMVIENGISSLPVVVGRLLVGIVTSTDLHLVLESLLAAANFASPQAMMQRA